VFVDGKPCGRSLTKLDQESKKVAKDKLEVYSCSLGHRSAFYRKSRDQSTGER
jgi:hypothetical protein